MTIIEAFRSGISSIFNGYATYDKAKDLFDIAEKKKPDKKQLLIGNNTWLLRMYDSFYIRLHATNIIELLSTGEFIINAKNWHTQLTKSRLETYVPILIHSDKGSWFFSPIGCMGERFKFTDGMVLKADGYPVDEKRLKTLVKEDRTTYTNNINSIQSEKTIKKIVPTLLEENQWGSLTYLIDKITDQKYLKQIVKQSTKVLKPSSLSFYEKLLKKIEDDELFFKSLIRYFFRGQIHIAARFYPYMFSKVHDQEFLKKATTYFLLNTNVSDNVKAPIFQKLLSLIKSKKFPLELYRKIPNKKIDILLSWGDFGTLSSLIKKIHGKDTDKIKEQFIDVLIKSEADSGKTIIDLLKSMDEVDHSYWLSLLDRSIPKETAIEILETVGTPELIKDIANSKNYSEGVRKAAIELNIQEIHRIEEINELKDLFKSDSKDIRSAAKIRFIAITDDPKELKTIIVKEPEYREAAMRALQRIDPEFVEKFVSKRERGKGFEKEDIKTDLDEKVSSHKKQLLRLLLPLAV